mgnify:CR=1 FL=1
MKKLPNYFSHSFEKHKIWPSIYYSRLINKIYSNNLAKSFFLVSSKKNCHIVKEIIDQNTYKIELPKFKKVEENVTN